MDLNDIPVFIRVVETSSFTKAADSLGLQKSSVSRSIVRLETELGVRLLQRTTRNLGLTDAGQTFYERVRGAITGFDDAAATVKELGTEPRGTIRMTAPPGAAAFGLAGAIAAFTQKYASIQVEVEMSARRVDLVSEGFDLALRAGRLADSSLIAKKVGNTDLVLMAAPSYLSARGRPNAPAELTTHECILRAARESWTLCVGETELVVDVQGRVQSNEINFVLRAAIAGGGIVALPPQLVREPFERGELEVVMEGYRVKGADLHIVMPSAAFVPTRVMLLRDHLVRELTREADLANTQCTARARELPALPVPEPLPQRRRKRS